MTATIDHRKRWVLAGTAALLAASPSLAQSPPAADAPAQRSFPGVAHEFFGMGTVVRGALSAKTYAVARLKPALR